MEFRLLGPLEVSEHERVLDLGAGKQRALFAILLLHANEVVSTTRLIDELWPEAAPRTAAKSIQVYVSGLRKELGDGRLVTRKPGYLLQVDPAELDSARFERLLAEAESAAPELAGAKLREALALWRGPPLADLADERFARPEIARLDALRLAALDQRIDADLATGRHAELVGELEALVIAHPLRERPRRQLMLALYRSGRQAEALTVYREVRRTLLEELGIEPSAELRAVERAILVRDPALDVAGAQDARGIFVGRADELAQLDAALAAVLAGSGRLVLLRGEPGIGKSRLIDELSVRAAARGAQLLVGRCWEAGGAPAYWPWIQALRAYLEATPDVELSARIRPHGPVLAQLLPELRERFPDLPDAEPLGSAEARFRLFDAVGSLLQGAARARPLVLCLDDVHAADEPSLLLLQFVARSLADSRLMIACAYRDVDPTPHDPLTAAVAQLVRERGTLRIALTGLREDDVTEYIARATGREPAPGLARALHARTDGNPLFLVEAVRLLEAEGGVGNEAVEAAIPPGVRPVIMRRIGRLSERCRTLLTAAAVLGRELELDELAQLSQLARDELLDLLDEAMSERLLGDVPGSPGRLRFGHALIRATIYDELTPARRIQLHRRAGAALEAVHSRDPGPHLAQLAQHFVAAGVIDKAISYARRAGDRAATQLAYEEAARLYQLALPLAHEPAERCELLLALADAHARSGYTEAARPVYLEAAELAAEHGLAEPLARAALGYGGRLIWDKGQDVGLLVALLERALAALDSGDSPVRVRLMSRLVCTPTREAGFTAERKSAMSRVALDMARRLGDPHALSYALDGYFVANESPANTRELLPLADEQLEAAARVGDKERVLEAHEHRLGRLLELGEVRAARAELDAMTALADQLRQPAQRWLVTASEARFALLEGRLADAERLIAAARDLGERTLGSMATATYRLQLYVLRREQGRVHEVRDVIRRAVAEQPQKPIWGCVASLVAAELGREADARRAFEPLAADNFAALPFEEMWLVGMGFLSETAHALADAERAAVLYDLQLPYADRVAVSYPEVATGSVARHLGLLATTLGRRGEARRHFDAALQLNEKIGARSWLARARRDRERALAAPAAGPAGAGSS